VQDSHAGDRNDADAAEAIRSLREFIVDVAEEKRSEIDGSIELLVRAIETNTVPKPEVVAAAETIAKGSPRLSSRLKAIGATLANKLSDAIITKAIDLAVSNLPHAS